MKLKTLVAAVAAVLLTACGGGGEEYNWLEETQATVGRLLQAQEQALEDLRRLAQGDPARAVLVASYNARAAELVPYLDHISTLCGGQKGREDAYFACRGRLVSAATPI